MRSVVVSCILIATLTFAGCKKAPAAVETRSTTPKDALLAVLQGMKEANPQKVLAACKTTPEQRPVIEAGAAYTREVYKFRDAFLAAYGQGAWDNFQDPAHRPGDYDCTFILITDDALEKAAKSEIIVDGNKAVCLMPAGKGEIKLIRGADGTWLADGATFVPADKAPEEIRSTMEKLTAIVKKYTRAIGKPNISPSDIDYEIGREINEMIEQVKGPSRHRFEIDKL